MELEDVRVNTFKTRKSDAKPEKWKMLGRDRAPKSSEEANLSIYPT
jgi:hypothetical protein